MNFRLRWIPCALFLAGAADFTIENVERDLRPRYPQLARVSDALPPFVVASENVTYATATGIPLQLDLYRPAAAGPHPAVLLVHGGGRETGSRQMERSFAKQLAVLGYVAVPVSYRLGPPGRFSAALQDLRSAVRWLRAHAPTLFVNSTAATPLLTGRPARRARLRAVGVDAELLVIPDTSHPFWLFHPWFEPMLRATDEFLAPAPQGRGSPLDPRPERFKSPRISRISANSILRKCLNPGRGG